MDFKRVSEFQDGLKDLGIAGNDITIYVDGKEVYRHFSGYQNIEKNILVNKDTMYRMFSMTKPITCAAAMQLFEEGRFLLNEKVENYLPEFKDMMVQTLDYNGAPSLKPAQKKMEIQHLFQMGAGLTYNLQTAPLKELYEKTNYDYTTEEFVKAIAKSPLIYEPGEHWYYSLAHDVLARLVEVWSGMTFGEYVQKHIFDPLEMTSATFHLTDEDRSKLCLRYGFDENGKFVLGDQRNEYQLSPRLESGGAGSSMTVDDYAKFAWAMTNGGVGLNGNRILASRTIDLMREDTLNDKQYEDLFTSGEAREGYSYGLGVRTMYDKAASGSASPVGEFGWGGAWGTFTLMDPENKLCLVFGEQGVDTQSVYIQRRLRNLAYAACEWEGLI